MYCVPCGTVTVGAAANPLLATPPEKQPLALAQICAGTVFGSTLT
jgi:hypothetical protein